MPAARTRPAAPPDRLRDVDPAGRRPRGGQEEVGLRRTAASVRCRAGLGAARHPDPWPVSPADRRAAWPRSASGPPNGPRRRAARCGVEYKQVGGRHFGANSIPARAWLDSYDDTWALLQGRRPTCAAWPS